MAKLKEPDHLPSEAQSYKDRIEKDSARRPGRQCAKCACGHFHRHQKRRRWFLVVVMRIVCPLRCMLCRWRCVNCGTTFTHLPPLCVPFKRYLRLEIEARCGAYVETDSITYRKVVKDRGAAVVYDDPIAEAGATEDEKEAEAVRELAASTPHRWIGAIAASREQWQPVVEQTQRSGLAARLSSILIAPGKYRSEARKRTLEACGLLLRAVKSVLPRNPTQLATQGSSP